MSDMRINEGNLAIIGSRSFNNFSYAKRKILEIITTNKIPITKIISGGASGADKIAEIFAEKFNIPITVLKADWSKGIQAGVVRNTDIIKTADYVIAFWDGKSPGTADSIKKAKKAGKKTFIIDISAEGMNEGVRLGDDGEYVFDFETDEKDDLLTLKYNDGFVTKKQTKGIISYYTYKLNRNLESKQRVELIKYIKNDLKQRNEYQHFLNKAIIGLFNNPNFELSDVDLVLIPQSASDLNLDLATKINDKIPNALFLKDGILKNEPSNVTINYDKVKEKKYSPETIISIEKMVERADVEGVFKIKKIPPRFRQFIINFLKIDAGNRKLLNRITDGKVLIVDDFISAGTTFAEVKRLVENYAPNEVIMYSLIA